MMGWVVGAGLVVGMGAAEAEGSFSTIYVFGDSLSDAGNLFAVTGQPPPPYSRRASNGPVWVEQLAPLVGAPVPTPSVAGGTNYAFAFGRATNTGLPPDLVPTVEMQVGQFLQGGHTPAAGELYVLWGGSNDLFDGQANPAIPATAIVELAKDLTDAGAKHLLVMNLPPIQLTPDFQAGSEAERQGAAAFVTAFNTLLANGLDALEATLSGDVNLYQFDVAGFFDGVIGGGLAHGLSNVTGRAFTLTPFPSVVPNPNEYLFWDGVHPTTAAHGILAAEVAAVIPEPAGVGTMTVGLAGVLLKRRGRPR
jgi:outer membrane lipase/esterase